MADAYGVSLDRLWAAVDGEQPSSHPDSQDVPEWLTLYAALEQRAARMWGWEPVTVHGLLQTPEYATAVERTAIDSTPESVAERVRVRIMRQGVLTRNPDPLHLSVVLDESVLLRVTGSASVMAAQLNHLASMAQRPNVELRIVPLSEGVHTVGWGTFTVLAKSGSVPPLVCDSDGTGVRYQESPHAVETHLRLFDHLAALALTPEASADLVRTTAKERYLALRV